MKVGNIQLRPRYMTQQINIPISRQRPGKDGQYFHVLHRKKLKIISTKALTIKGITYQKKDSKRFRGTIQYGLKINIVMSDYYRMRYIRFKPFRKGKK